MAEQLGLEQLLGKGGAVDRNERLRRARAVRVDRARDQLLARTGLAEHQDVRFRAGRLADELEDLRHGRAAADEIFEAERSLQLLAEVPVLELELALAQATLDRHAQLVHREVLGQVVEGPVLDRGDRRFDGGEGGEQNDRKSRIHLASAAQHLHAVHARHLEVGQQEVGTLRLDERERAMRVGRGQTLVAGPLQDAGTVLDHIRLVVDHQHALRRHARSPGREPWNVRTNVVPSPGVDRTSTVPW